MRVTLRPRDSRIAARDAEAMPLPSEDTTPPVTKTNLVIALGKRIVCECRGGKARLYRRPSGASLPRIAMTSGASIRHVRSLFEDDPGLLEQAGRLVGLGDSR